ANQLQLYFASFAYIIMHALRRLGLDGTVYAKAQCTTIRLKLLKIGARIRITVRKVWLSWSESYPYAHDFARILAHVRRHPVGGYPDSSSHRFRPSITPAHRRWPVSFTPELQTIAFSVSIASQIDLRAPCGDRIALGARPDRFHRDKKQSEVADCSNR